MIDLRETDSDEESYVFAMAISTDVPRYITPFRMYPVLRQYYSDNAFIIYATYTIAEDTSPLFCLWNKCPHLNEGDWRKLVLPVSRIPSDLLEEAKQQLEQWKRDQLEDYR